jgi:hypothetical protein
MTRRSGTLTTAISLDGVYYVSDATTKSLRKHFDLE